jgi:hypothetical protein
VTFQLIVILKAINEVALMAMIGQAALFVLAGSRRDSNVVYTLLKTVTAPVMKVARFVSPRFVIDAHVGFVAFFLLLLVEAVLIVLKIRFYFATVAG